MQPIQRLKKLYWFGTVMISTWAMILKLQGQEPKGWIIRWPSYSNPENHWSQSSKDLPPPSNLGTEGWSCQESLFKNSWSIDQTFILKWNVWVRILISGPLTDCLFSISISPAISAQYSLILWALLNSHSKMYTVCILYRSGLGYSLGCTTMCTGPACHAVHACGGCSPLRYSKLCK